MSALAKARAYCDAHFREWLTPRRLFFLVPILIIGVLLAYFRIDVSRKGLEQLNLTFQTSLRAIDPVLFANTYLYRLAGCAVTLRDREGRFDPAIACVPGFYFNPDGGDPAAKAGAAAVCLPAGARSQSPACQLIHSDAMQDADTLLNEAPRRAHPLCAAVSDFRDYVMCRTAQSELPYRDILLSQQTDRRPELLRKFACAPLPAGGCEPTTIAAAAPQLDRHCGPHPSRQWEHSNGAHRLVNTIVGFLYVNATDAMPCAVKSVWREAGLLGIVLVVLAFALAIFLFAVVSRMAAPLLSIFGLLALGLAAIFTVTGIGFTLLSVAGLIGIALLLVATMETGLGGFLLLVLTGLGSVVMLLLLSAVAVLAMKWSLIGLSMAFGMALGLIAWFYLSFGAYLGAYKGFRKAAKYAKSADRWTAAASLPGAAKPEPPAS